MTVPISTNTSQQGSRFELAGSDDVLSLRPLLFSVAYKMTKSVADTEDILQEVFLDYSKNNTGVASLKKYLARSVINRSLNLLERKKKVHYPGVDLPEPVAPQRFDYVSTYDISFGLMVLLHKLSPLERAVFVLKESFDYDYHEVAQLLAIREDNCRQLFHRAKEKVQRGESKYLVSKERKEAFVKAFMRACQSGNQQELLAFLQRDVTIYSDGGGKALAAPQPLYGVEICAKFLLTIHRKRKDEELQIVPTLLNGMPAAIYRNRQNDIDTVILLEVANDAVQGIYFVRNPDKLLRL